MRSVSIASSPLELFVLPPPVSEESSLFEPPKTGNSEKLFPLIPFGKFQAVLNERSLNIHRNFSSYISEKRPMIRTPENKTIRKTFSPLIAFGKISAVLNERKLKNKEKALKVGCMRRSCHSELDFQDSLFFRIMQTPGALISRKFTREGGAVGWNTITEI